MRRSMSTLNRRWGWPTSFIAAISIVFFLSYSPIHPTVKANHGIISPSQADSNLYVEDRLDTKVALPFRGHLPLHLPNFPLKFDEHDPALTRRAYPNTLTYADALCNGRRYWAQAQAGNANPPRVTQDRFVDSGWSLNEGYPKVIADDLKTPIEKLGISSNTDDIYRVAAQQYSEFRNLNGQRQDDPSGTQYLQTYIPTSGTIIASENISPQQAIAMYRRDNGLPAYTPTQYRDFVPKLQRWSDLAWFVWAQKAGGEQGNLRYIFRDNVINNDTKGVIDQVFKIPSYSFDLKWPGKTFDVATTDDGKALLGTPHGSGIAWILADHKDVLGNRGLKITCFTGDGFFRPGTQYYMLFELTRG
ncbi:MAG: hypothetical protein Q9218_000012 [Villophora microphyllina]